MAMAKSKLETKSFKKAGNFEKEIQRKLDLLLNQDGRK